MITVVLVAVILGLVFGGIATIVGVVVAGILLGQGKLTLPNTNMRRLAREKADVEVAKMRLERESLEMRRDDAVAYRLERMNNPETREPGADFDFKGGN